MRLFKAKNRACRLQHFLAARFPRKLQ